MKNFTYAIGSAVAAALLALAIAPSPARAQQASRAGSAASGNVEAGRKAFVQHSCYSCHGYEAEGGVGARLVGYPDTVEAFVAYIRKPGGVMPPAGATITSQQLRDIYAWVRSIPPSPDAKSIALLKP